MSALAAGYSGTPLWEKLGLKPGMRVIVLNPPAGFDALLSGAPSDLTQLARLAGFDFALAFVLSGAALASALAKLEPRLAANGMIWMSWPKKASGVATDIDENAVRHVGLALGLVDVKVCAIDATRSLSGLLSRMRRWRFGRQS
jgi:hypothetical protein